MDYLPNGITLHLPSGVFPLSTDSMVLAHFCRNSRGMSWLDLGSGGGTLGLLLYADNPIRQIIGIESDSVSHAAAEENIRSNHLQNHITSIHADLRDVPQMLPTGRISCCIANPPYFSSGPVSRTLAAARHRGNCTIKDFCTAAAWAVQYGGDFFLVSPPSALAEWIAAGEALHLTAKNLRLVRHRPDAPISLVLLRMRKGGHPGLKLEEITLHDAQGNPTDAYRQIYHL